MFVANVWRSSTPGFRSVLLAFIQHLELKGQHQRMIRMMSMCLQNTSSILKVYFLKERRQEFSLRLPSKVAPVISTTPMGAGAFAPVAPEVYNFEVSGLKVVQHWLGYRMREPKGKKSSPLDDIHPQKWTRDFTDELLELLWILEATIAEYPRQAKLLTRVAKGRKIRL